MKSIAFFNNKGGVGKTTLLCNVASSLALDYEKKVLIIDADPQSNSTAYIIGDEKYQESLFKPESLFINNIYDSHVSGDGNLTNLPNIAASSNFGVDIILGSPKLSRLEDLLAKDWVDAISGQPRGFKTTFALKEVLARDAIREKYDYVLIDLGPSLGAINRSVVLAADFFIMPLSTDIFSLMAIDNIDTSFSNWRKDLQSGTERFQENNLEYFEKMKTLISWDLSFLGFVTQQYRAKRKEGVPVPVKAFETIRLRQAERLETFCQNFHMSYEEANLGEIPTLSSVIPLSQEANIPIAKLTSEHGIVGSNFNRVKEAGDFYKNVANKIILSIEGDA